jgi:hypothetical protein
MGCAETLTTGTATDYTTLTDFPVGNMNFSNVVTISPNAPTAVAVGAKVGGLRSLTNLGLINAPCTTPLTIDFILYNVALPNAATRAAMTNIAWPQPEGTPNRHERWRVDDGTHTTDPPSTADPEWADPTDTVVTSTDGTTADGTTLAFANYPSHLLDLFDPDFIIGVSNGSLEPKIPLAAYGGMTLVSGTWIPLYFLVFPATGANSLSGGTALPAPLGDINASMGFPSVSVLTDPSAAIASPSSITDFCIGNASLNITTMLRSTVHTNPAAGTQMFVQYNASQRSTDQDPWENQIDTCPYNAVPAENPSNLLGVNDTDGDGIMNSCDTNGPYLDGPPITDTCLVNAGATCNDSDVDNDLFSNRQDNCPQVYNPLQSEGEAGVAPADKGPRSDGMGNECDGAEGGNPPASGSITITQNGIPNGGTPTTTTITLSDTVANGRYMTRTNVVAKCFSGTDLDGDGYCTAGGVTADSADSGACAGTVPNSCAVRHSLWSGAAHPLLQQESDGDSVAPTVGLQNFFTDAVETYLTTDPTKPCAQTPTPPSANANNEGPLDNWPLDMNDDSFVTGSDILKYNTVLGLLAGGNRAVNMGGAGDGTATTPATIATVPLMGVQSQTRFDLNTDGQLTGADILKFNAYFSKKCSDPGAPPLTLGGTFQQ